MKHFVAGATGSTRKMPGDPAEVKHQSSGQARRPASIRLRLIVLAVVALAVSLGLTGLALDSAYTRSSETELGSQMETWVYLVLSATEIDGQGAIQVQDDIGDPRLSQPGSGNYVHVHGDTTHWSSPSALGVSLPELPAVPAGQSVFRTAENDSDYYVFQYGVAWELADEQVQPFTISVLVAGDRLGKQIRAFRGGLWRSLGAAGLILAFAQFLFFTLGMRPLKQVARDVELIETGERENLQGPYPRELEPLTRNLNRLMNTEKANQARYRNALDSLAHSLKTPLAVMRAALPGAQTRDNAAMAHAVDEMQYLVTSRLERAAASTRRTLSAPVRVRPVADRIIATLQKIHSHKMQNVHVMIPDDLDFYGEERDLMEMLGNLLDNACKYGDGRIQLSADAVRSEKNRPGLWLKIENNGKPVPEELRATLSQRGVRGDERVEGHGLGLTIVTELVSAYGGEISLKDSELGGTCFTITIPPA